MSRLVAKPTGQLDVRFKPVGHPGGAGMVTGERGREHRTQAGGRYIPSLMDVQVDSAIITGSSCWPPRGQCTSCGIEGYKRLRAPCIAQGRHCENCGSQGHLARVCIKRKNLHTEMNRGYKEHKEGIPARIGYWNGDTRMQALETKPAQETSPLQKGLHPQQTSTTKEARYSRDASNDHSKKTDQHTLSDEESMQVRETPQLSEDNGGGATHMAEVVRGPTTDSNENKEKIVPDKVHDKAAISNHSTLTRSHIHKPRKSVECESPNSNASEKDARPWTIPPTVIQIPLQETRGRSQQPHSKRNRGRQKKSSGNSKKDDLQNATDKMVADGGPKNTKNAFFAYY